MIQLIDGLGQLGTALNELLKEEGDQYKDIDVTIYHTWDFMDKREEIQKKYYENFKKFVDEHPNIKIIFISTISQAENPYVFYKQLSEAYLLENNKNGHIIRLPNLIGKGVCRRFREEKDINSFGELELMTIKDAARNVLNFIKTGLSVKSFTVKGVSMPATMTKNLIVFGRDGAC